jgi:tetratricopeptide (TPR) repeat protein
MIDAASGELDAIQGEERLSTEVMAARSDLFLAARKWDAVVAVAKVVAVQRPGDGKGWIDWAFALHELQRTAEAKDVLLQAERFLKDTPAVLHYNLACYHCLLGEMTEAKHRLRQACRLDADFKKTALDDPDLKAMRDYIATLK